MISCTFNTPFNYSCCVICCGGPPRSYHSRISGATRGAAGRSRTAPADSGDSCCFSRTGTQRIDPDGSPGKIRRLRGALPRLFEYPAGGRDVAVQLLELRQGTKPAADYAVKFRTLAAQSGWNDPALLAVFREGLCPALQAEMACRSTDVTLSEYITTAIHLDNLLRQQRRTSHPRYEPRVREDYSRPREEGPEPMQLGGTRVSLEERQRRARRNLCFYCGGTGHWVNNCPEKPSTSKIKAGAV
ncbi:hypothetical protein PHYPO_G00197480 [Pangasianodon hypophthalmus]|uniref:CCHC-type domain-containing protein n=1 Tax=Pangasianodon hypophthalmus TaxID=310915 RepID=A0A5N5PLA6_PANHP|nr:hypothetical protein PHYPO_G00197480 [Pangasianodon hypophthalmus]